MDESARSAAGLAAAPVVRITSLQGQGSHTAPIVPGVPIPLSQAYAVLGLPPGASVEDATAAYKLRARMLHPDKHQGATEDVRAEAGRAMQQLNDALEAVRRTASQPFMPTAPAGGDDSRPPRPPSTPAPAPPARGGRAWPRWAASALALAVLVGVRVASSPDETTPAPPPPEQTEQAQTQPQADPRVDPAPDFSNTTDVIAAIRAAGLTCDDVSAGTYEGVSEAVSCIFEESEDVIVMHFGSASERAGYLANRDELSSTVMGDDWAVQTVLEPTARTIAQALGADVV